MSGQCAKDCRQQPSRLTAHFLGFELLCGPGAPFSEDGKSQYTWCDAFLPSGHVCDIPAQKLLWTEHMCPLPRWAALTLSAKAFWTQSQASSSSRGLGLQPRISAVTSRSAGRAGGCGTVSSTGQPWPLVAETLLQLIPTPRADGGDVHVKQEASRASGSFPALWSTRAGAGQSLASALGQKQQWSCVAWLTAMSHRATLKGQRGSAWAFSVGRRRNQE